MKKVKAFLDAVPHWVTVLIVTAVAVFWQNLQAQPSFMSALLHWDKLTFGACARAALATTLVWLVGYLKTDPWTASAQARAKASTLPPPPLVVLALGCAGLLGCVPLNSAVPSDLGQAYACVQEGLIAKLNALQIEAKCLPGQLQTVLDIVEMYLTSPQWRADHPGLIPVAESVKIDLKAHLKAGDQ
jgi:hypothetical protein